MQIVHNSGKVRSKIKLDNCASVKHLTLYA